MKLPAGLGRHVVRHPTDAIALVTAGWAMRRRGWWHRRPFLPVPDEDYWRFRLVTAFGRDDATPTVDDVVAAARWSQRQRRSR